MLKRLFLLLLNSLLSLEGKVRREPKPKITRYSESRYAMIARLQRHNIIVLYGMMDSQYAYTDHLGWNDVLRWIYINCEMPQYTVKEDGTWNTDCEDMAIWLKAMVSLHFGLNGFGIIVGDMSIGRHGFNLLIEPDEELVWEPNPGFGYHYPMEIGENEYKPLYWFG